MKRVVLLLVLCLLALPQTGWSMTLKEFEDRAIPLLNSSKEADRLIKICNDALADAKSDPDFEAYIHVFKSHAFFMKKDYPRAETEARIVIDSGYQAELGHSALRDVLFARDRFDEGLEVCLKGASKIKGERNQDAARQDCEDAYLEKTAVPAAALWNAYKKSAATADAKYKGHPINIIGTVTSVEPRGAEDARLTFALDKSGSKNVICLLGTASPEATPAPGKQTGKAKDGGSIEYSLNGDNSGTGSKPDTTKKDTAKKGKDGKSPALDLPAPGETVAVSGSVQGMEGNDLVLIDCTKLR